MRKNNNSKKKINILNLFKKKKVKDTKDKTNSVIKEKNDEKKKKLENNNNSKNKLNIFKKKTDEKKKKVTPKIENSKNKKNDIKTEKTEKNHKNLNTKKSSTKSNIKISNNKKNISKKKKKKKKIIKKKQKRSFWKKLLTFILIMCIFGVLLVASFFAYIVLSAPEFNEEAFKANDQTVVYDSKGELIAKLGLENRENVTYDDLPQVLIDAIIATEDSRYFQHNGVDLPRFIKASVYQLMGKSGAGGASTLTMQMVKNNLTSTEDEGIKGIIRKFHDVYLSVFKVEQKYSKQQIIELYVNNHNLGSSVYGVGEASKYYFGKSVSELTLPEAALLAGLFQAPNRHNPYYNIESAEARRNTVLKLMVRHGYITQEEADMANSVDIETQLVGIKKKTDYQAYIDYVTEEVIKLTGQDPSKVPMKIYTTMDKKIQDGINKIMNDKKASYWKNSTVQAGIAVVDVKTGAISALSGQRNNDAAKIWSYATDTLRQPGSTAKPIFAYGPSFEYLNASTYGFYIDEAWSYTNGPSVNNWDRKFMGIITTRRAVEVSRNIPALKAYQQVGSKKVQEFAYSLGLDVAYSTKSENYRIVDENTGIDNTINESYAIGGVAEGFSPLMMASAYSAFASGGYYTEAYSVKKIEMRETGEIIEPKHTKKQVMKASTAYMMNYMLESAANNGFTGGANVYGSHVAAKTGTTNFTDNAMKQLKLPSHAVNDVWTVAYTSKHSIAVWYGYDQASSKYYTGIGDSHKDRLTAAVMKYIPKDTKGWTPPSSVIKVAVEKESYPAKLPSEYTPEKMITTEYFVKGTQPTEVSDRYTKIPDISDTKLEVTGNIATISWNHILPASLTDEYIENHFSQSIFNKSRAKLIADRKKYNTNTLGEITFGIYKEVFDGTNTTLQLIEYTTANSYTYTGTEPTTLVIKAEHSKYKKNMSDGIKFIINFINDPTTELNVTLSGNSSVETPVNTYIELGIESIMHGGTNVRDLSNIKYKLINGLTSTEYIDTVALQTAVNALPVGTYQIEYIVNYDGIEIIKKRTITLK